MMLNFLGSCTPKPPGSLLPGETPPQFELSDLQGNKVSLSSFTGKLVLLNFWASWCAPCIEELPYLQKLHTRGQSDGIVVVSVAVDRNTKAISELVQANGVSYPVLMDKDMLVSDRYKSQGFPETFIIGPDGKIMLFADPESGQAVSKLTGPRNWSSEKMYSALKALIPQKK